MHAKLVVGAGGRFMQEFRLVFRVHAVGSDRADLVEAITPGILVRAKRRRSKKKTADKDASKRRRIASSQLRSRVKQLEDERQHLRSRIDHLEQQLRDQHKPHCNQHDPRQNQFRILDGMVTNKRSISLAQASNEMNIEDLNAELNGLFNGSSQSVVTELDRFLVEASKEDGLMDELTTELTECKSSSCADSNKESPALSRSISQMIAASLPGASLVDLPRTWSDAALLPVSTAQSAREAFTALPILSI